MADELNSRREAADRAHFDSIAERYSAKDEAPSSRPARRRRVERTVATLPVEGLGRVLEIGCGAGFGAEYLRGRFEQYVGIDHSRRLIEVAREKNSGHGVSFEASSIAEFDPESPFDVIFMIGVLHHLENPSVSVGAMVRWLRPGGFLVANEPQPGNPLIRVARRARARHDSCYSSEQEEISAGELRSLFRDAGLEEIEITAQGFASTPFAEIALKPYRLMAPLARSACAVDDWIEKRGSSWTRKLSWNLIACGHSRKSAPG
jgi:2-polyprenyl-3-methyl-5-hydroxy-6-metoxy-1,4-benzoquinol methylase